MQEMRGRDRLRSKHQWIAPCHRSEPCLQGGNADGSEARFLRKELKLKSKDMAAALSMKPDTYLRWENEKQSVSPICDKQLRLVYILNVTEEEGHVLHKNIRGMITAMAIRPFSEQNRIEINAADWLVPITPPIFGVEV
jgi:transcriptional regulator with XRE-family HTH domain